MINLLSQERQKRIYREYLLRIATVACIAFGVVWAAFIALLVPSYLKLTSDIERVNAEREGKRSQISVDDQNGIAEAQAFAAEVNVLRGAEAARSIVGFIERVIELKPSQIALMDFDYSESQDGRVALQVRGIAATRDDLIRFRDALEAHADFSAVALPAQTLIKRTDIQFALTLEIKGAAPAAAPVPPPPGLDEGENTLLP